MCAAAEAKTSLGATLGDNASLVSDEVREGERKRVSTDALKEKKDN